ncbi:hypothetical protein FPV67DRAFT_1511439 [Lyophyllum atratum]|nr:hypothetical protein FPV67DRAFT_1511439 [Lyophyllum atratum]
MSPIPTMIVSEPPLVGRLTNVGNNSKATATRSIPGSSALFKGSETVVSVLNCKMMTMSSDGALSIPVESGMPPVSRL